MTPFVVLVLAFCAHGVTGRAFLPKEIYANVNESFVVNCNYTDIKAHETLGFYANNFDFGNAKVTGNTSIQLIHSFPEPTRQYIYCKLDGSDIIDYTIVNVAHKPGNVSDFNCFTTNLKELKCSFIPFTSTIPINYQLYYKRKPSNKSELEQCDLQQNLTHYGCSLFEQKLGTSFEQQVFKFTLKSQNKIGEFKARYHVRVLKVVKPKMPRNLKVLVSDEMNVLTFQQTPVILPIDNPEQMRYEVKYQIEGEETWTTWKKKLSFMIRSTKKRFRIHLDDFIEPFTKYRLRLRGSSKIAGKWSTWSDYVETYFETKPNVPKDAPFDCPSSFQRLDNGSVILYWKNIEIPRQNILDMKYGIVGYNNFGLEILKISTLESRMMLQNLPLSNLSFSIYTFNQEGYSKCSSQLKFDNTPTTIHSTNLQAEKKIIDDQQHVFWSVQQEKRSIKSFTILWCKKLNEDDNACEDPIEWRYVGPSSRKFAFVMTGPTNFAVAVNYADSSSDSMVWATNSEIRPPIKKIILGARRIELKWEADSNTKATGSVFISYCPVNSSSQKKCSELSQTRIFSASDKFVMLLDDLKSRQLYKITMKILDHPDFPERVMYAETEEEAPSSPVNLKIIKVEQNAATLSWEKPLRGYGPDTYYSIMTKVEGFLSYNFTYAFYAKDQIQYEIKNLFENTNYLIHILACNIDHQKQSHCSPIMKPLKFTTLKPSDFALISDTWNFVKTQLNRLAFW